VDVIDARTNCVRVAVFRECVQQLHLGPRGFDRNNVGIHLSHGFDDVARASLARAQASGLLAGRPAKLAEQFAGLLWRDLMQQILRHTDIKTTFRYYVHSDTDAQRDALSQISISTICTSSTAVSS
jgi:integrase